MLYRRVGYPFLPVLFLGLLLQIAQGAAVDDELAVVPRDLQDTGGIGLLYEEDECPCANPLTGVVSPDVCYYAVCPAGYFKCCYDCDVSTCVNNGPLNNRGDSGALELVMSMRGYFECVPCQPGDYCLGCDIFEECPHAFKGDEGNSDTTPKISGPMSFQLRDCKKCPDNTEASVDRTRCEPAYRDKCQMSLFEDCVQGCEYDTAEQLECEKMACHVYCASVNTNKECLSAFTDQCISLNTPFIASQDVDFMDDLQGALTEEELAEQEQQLVLTSDDGMADYIAVQVPYPCANRCNSAVSTYGTLGVLAGLVMAAIASL